MCNAATSCSSSTCGVTLAPGATAPATQYYCCSFLTSQANTYCTGVPTAQFAAGTTFNLTAIAGVAALGGLGGNAASPTQCTTSNCVSAGNMVAASPIVLLIAVLLALAKMF
jgi:hypothetical protein